MSHSGFSWAEYPAEDQTASPESIGPDALFGAFVALAVILEVEQDHRKITRSYTPSWLQSATRPIEVLRLLLLERLGNRPGEVSWQDALGRCHFTPEQDAFVRRWIEGEVSFIDLADAGATAPPKRTRRLDRKQSPSKSEEKRGA